MSDLGLLVGDIFSIPVDEDLFMVGQIAANRDGELYIAVYEGQYSTRNIVLDEVDFSVILLLALSLDAKFFHGNWQMFGHKTDNLTDIPNAFYKVRIGEIFFIVSQDQSVVREATSDEVAFLRFRTGFSPAAVEGALKALSGLDIWYPAYEEMKPDYAYECRRRFYN